MCRERETLSFIENDKKYHERTFTNNERERERREVKILFLSVLI